MIIGIGTDIVEIYRIQAMWEKHGDRLAERFLAPAELECFQAVTAKVPYLAKRVAAKEAASKALGTGFAQGVSWRHIEVTNDEHGAPRLKLYGEALAKAEQRGVTHCHLSLSDEREFAVAFVVLEAAMAISHDVQSGVSKGSAGKPPAI